MFMVLNDVHFRLLCRHQQAVLMMILIFAPLRFYSSFSLLSTQLTSFSKWASLKANCDKRHVLLSNNNEAAWSDWVVENLTSSPESLGDEDTDKDTKAGESDTLPPGGLLITGSSIQIKSYVCRQAIHVLPAISRPKEQEDNMENEGALDCKDALVRRIYLLSRPNGWGTGVHPSTRLCLDWLLLALQHNKNMVMMDYGCGSAILSLAALGLGAHKAICIDVDSEALVTADANFKFNGYTNTNDRNYYQLLHVRQVEPYCFTKNNAVDICVANILIGQLVRPSMISALMTNIQPSGLICFSGIRPWEVDSLRAAYEPYLEWLDDHYAELNAQQTEGSVESYGFDVGPWARVVGRIKPKGIDVRDMSEMAVM